MTFRNHWEIVNVKCIEKGFPQLQFYVDDMGRAHYPLPQTPTEWKVFLEILEEAGQYRFTPLTNWFGTEGLT